MQGRSLWPLLTSPKGAATPTGGEFRSAYVELGYGGLHYGEHEHPELHFPALPASTSSNTVTQSGTVKALRMGRWKLTFDMLGHGQLFDLEADPAELHNRFQDRVPDECARSWWRSCCAGRCAPRMTSPGQLRAQAGPAGLAEHGRGYPPVRKGHRARAVPPGARIAAPSSARRAGAPGAASRRGA